MQKETGEKPTTQDTPQAPANEGILPVTGNNNNQTASQKPISVDELKENEEMMKILASFGVTEEKLDAAKLKTRAGKSGSKKTNHRKVHMANIAMQASKIEEDHGSSLVTAEKIRQSLDALGLANTAEGRPLRKANALGDACGLEGLQLPRIQHAGRWNYDVSMASATEEEKVQRQQAFDQLPDEALKAICDRTTTDAEAA